MTAADPAAAAPIASGEHRAAGAATGGTPPARSPAPSAASAFMLVVNFFLFRVLPGDPARTLGRGRLSTPEQLEEFNETYGLDQSIGQQFVTFLKNTVHGRPRATRSSTAGPVSEILADRLWPTLLLVGTVDRARRADRRLDRASAAAGTRGSRFDRFSTGSSLTLYSMPEWWLGLVLIAVFAVGTGPLPGPVPDRRPALRRTSTRRRSRACWTRSGTSRCR